MSCYNKENIINEAIYILAEQGFDGFSEIMAKLINEAMIVERERHLRAHPYERTSNRLGYSNGFKPRSIDTRVGTLKLQVPQVRESDKPFYPSFLERGIRSERALKLAIAEMYVNGVATRKVEKILKELCGTDVSSSEVSNCAKMLDEELSKWRDRKIGECKYMWIDARYEKVRHGGSVVDSAVLIAYGLNNEGKRRVLGVSVALSEAEVHWRAFFENLVSRGLHGLELIISDCHSGLSYARKAVFPSVKWQRCQFHLQQNAQKYVPKKSMSEAVAADIRAVFNAPDVDEANRLLLIMVEKYKDSAPKLSTWMEHNIPQGLTVMSFETRHQKRLRTTNMPERVNQELKRRTSVVGIFPNTDSCLRLVSAVLVEIDEKWSQGSKYLN